MLKPLFARVLLRREKFTKSGSILIPGAAQKRMASTKCTVVATGPTADESIKVGSTVLIGRFAGDWLREDGSVVAADAEDAEFYICADEDLLCEVSDA
jgi:co-chaperonin GroES (HSP10)